MFSKNSQFLVIMLVLCLGYTISQFLRTSVGVLAPDLMLDFGINPDKMGLLGGIFFCHLLCFKYQQVFCWISLVLEKLCQQLLHCSLGSIIFACLILL